MTDRIAPEDHEMGSARVAQAFRSTVLEPDGEAEILEGTLDAGSSGIGVWASADSVVPITPMLPEGRYRVAIRTRSQPPVERGWTEHQDGAARLSALDMVLVFGEGSTPVRWDPAQLGGDATAPVWKHFALVDPEQVAIRKERRAEQWLEVMRSPSPDGGDGLFLPDAGGPPGVNGSMQCAEDVTSVPRLRVSEFRGPSAVPGDVITGADVIAWVGVDEAGTPTALALDVGSGVRRRAANFVDVRDAWAEPVGEPVGRPRLGPRISWRFPYSEHFVRRDDGDREIGMLSTPVRIGALRFPSGRIALTAVSLRESLHLIDAKVPRDRDLPCFVSGELHREPAVLIRVADGRPVSWHLAQGREGHPGMGTNGTVLVVTDAEVAQQAVRGRRRPDGNAQLRMRLHTPEMHSIARPEGDALAINLVSPTILPIVGVDGEGKLVAVSFLASQSPDMISGPQQVVDILNLNVMAREHAVCVFAPDEGYVASVAVTVPLHGHNDRDHHDGPEDMAVAAGQVPPGFDQARFDIVQSQRDPLDIVGLSRVVEMASGSGTSIVVDRCVDGWRWGFVSRSGIEGLQRAVSDFTGVRGGKVESEAFSFVELNGGWWMLSIDVDSGEEPTRLDRTILELQYEIDVEAAALLLRERFAL